MIVRPFTRLYDLKFQPNLNSKMASERAIFLIFSLIYFSLFLLVIVVAFGIYKLKLHYRFLFKVSGIL